VLSLASELCICIDRADWRRIVRVAALLPLDVRSTFVCRLESEPTLCRNQYA
jgi:hypothetical protein